MHISAENVPCLNCQLKSELSVKPYPDPLTETLTNLSPLPPWGLTQGHLIPRLPGLVRKMFCLLYKLGHWSRYAYTYFKHTT